MSHAVTDRTGYTCLYSVYTTTTHACSVFEPSALSTLNLPICSSLQGVQIPSESQNLLSFDYFITVVFHKFLCLL